MSDKQKYVFMVLALVAAFSAGRFLGPKSVEVKESEKIVYRDHIRQDDKHNIHTEIRETIHPDGTKTIETIKDSNRERVTESQRQVDSEKSKQSISVNQSNWGVGVYTDKRIISGVLDRRILGGLFFGLNVIGDLQSPDLKGLVGLRLEF